MNTHRDVVTPIERASAIDLMELVPDTGGSCAQVAAVLSLRTPEPLTLADVRNAVAARVHGVPRLTQRLVAAPFGCGRPVWWDDPGFDVRHHVTAVPCPAPGDEAALLDLVAELATTWLPPYRSPWSLTLVTGLDPGRAPGDAALVVVLHHVLADGIGFVTVLGHLLDGAALPGGAGAASPVEFPRPAPTRRQLFGDAVRTRVRDLTRAPAGLRAVGAALRELGAGRTPRPPRSSLNRPTGPRRRYAVARTDLAAVREVAHRHGATVNDVVLAAVAGALASLLRHRGEAVDRFVATVPVSARREATTAHLGNQVGVIPVPVTAVPDPQQRLRTIAAVTRARKTRSPGASAALLAPAFRTLGRLRAFRWYVDRQRRVTTFVTNLRGPPDRLSFLGTTVTDVIPVSSTTGNITTAFAVLSYAGRLVITVVADRDRCPDQAVLAAALQRELDVLTGTGGATEGARGGARTRMPFGSRF